MSKKKLLYASPFPPQKSGISDYSEVLVLALRKFFDITLLIEDYQLSSEKLKSNFECLIYNKDHIDYNAYDYKIYNIGNNPQYHSYIYELCLKYPGMIIMHDYVLYYLVVGFYQQKGIVYSKIYEIGGLKSIIKLKQLMQKDQKNLLEYKSIAAELPLNMELIQSGNKIMVHSNYTKNRIERIMKSPIEVRKINHVLLEKDDLKLINKEELFLKYGIPMDCILISSLGYIAETKLNHLVCEAVLNLREKTSKKICYVMVGEGGYVDDFVDQKVIFKTGFVTLNEFDSFLEYSDIIVNLRYPSMGETSGGMIRIMEHGKASIIVNDGWFAEIPKDCAVSLELNQMDQLENKLQLLITNEDYKKQLGNNAYKYVHEHFNADKICEEIKNYLETV